jgi:hypothetical protein
MSLKHPLLIILLATLYACGSKGKKEAAALPPADPNELMYFSMTDFVKDQWEIFKLQPYTFFKFVTKDGKTDSSMVSAYEMDLGEIMLAFVRTDIGRKEFLNKYNFSVVDEGASFTRTYYYEALEDDLYTRTLQVTTDPTNNRIKAVFVEAVDTKSSPRKSVKLYYAPHKVIQETTKSTMGSAKEVKTEYRFPQDESSFDEEPNFDE